MRRQSETTPRFLIRLGWTRPSVKAGDRVVIEIHPLRDGANGGDITTPDGSFRVNVLTRAAEVIDGLSSTALGSESLSRPAVLAANA